MLKEQELIFSGNLQTSHMDPTLDSFLHVVYKRIVVGQDDRVSQSH